MSSLTDVCYWKVCETYWSHSDVFRHSCWQWSARVIALLGIIIMSALSRLGWVNHWVLCVRWSLERRLNGDSDFKNEGGMRTSADGRGFYKMVDAATAEGRGQSKEQHERVSRPCIRTKGKKQQRERRWKPRWKTPQPSQKCNESGLGN